MCADACMQARRNLDQHVCSIDLTQALEASATNKAENPAPETSNAPADVEQAGSYLTNHTPWLNMVDLLGSCFICREILDSHAPKNWKEHW